MFPIYPWIMLTRLPFSIFFPSVDILQFRNLVPHNRTSSRFIAIPVFVYSGNRSSSEFVPFHHRKETSCFIWIICDGLRRIEMNDHTWLLSNLVGFQQTTAVNSSLVMGRETISMIKDTRYLGVYVDQHLKWSAQIIDLILGSSGR